MHFMFDLKLKKYKSWDTLFSFNPLTAAADYISFFSFLLAR